MPAPPAPRFSDAAVRSGWEGGAWAWEVIPGSSGVEVGKVRGSKAKQSGINIAWVTVWAPGLAPAGQFLRTAVE